MTLALFLLDPLPGGDVVILDGAEGRHAATVKRVGVGEALLLGNGRGAVLSCRVRAVAAGQVTLEVLGREFIAPAEPRLVVVQALPKGDRAELAVELLTELGVDEILPWAASRSIVQWQGERATKARDRWQRTAREAGKQSRRPWLPIIGALASTADVAQRLSEAGTALVLHEQAAVGIGAVAVASAGEVVVVVGPEGGISPAELDQLVAAGATAVRLGSSVLRTSTAGAAAIAALNLRLSRWN